VTKGERFGIGTVVIGLAADVLTIVDHLRWRAEDASTTGSLPMPILMAVTTTYGWLILAWFLTKWRFFKDKEQTLTPRKRKPDFPMTAFRAVFTIGIVISPIVMYIGYSINQIAGSMDAVMLAMSSLFIGAVVGFAIFGVVYHGMPLIYEEIK